MKPKTMILMIVAVVCGLGASYMTSRLLAERSDTPADAPVIEKVKLLVTKNTIAMHASLGKKPETFFIEKEFVKEDAPKDALVPADLVKLKDKFLKRGLRKGDHITVDDLMDGNSWLPTLPDGMRGVGIPVSSQVTAAGFACVPGSHVDIYWTTRTGNDNETISKVLLEDVVVLAADIRLQNDTGGAMPSNVVTVALSPNDSLSLANAMETGSIRLVLRNLEDRSSGSNQSVSRSQLLKGTGSKYKDPFVAMVNPTPPEVKPEPPVVEPKSPKVTPPEPEPVKLTKVTVWVRNGAEVRLHHYWVDEQDRIVAPGGGNEQHFDAVPPLTGNSKNGGTSPDVNGGGGF